MAKPPKMRIGKLSEFRPQVENVNVHSERGLSLLEKAMQGEGYVSPMTAVADGEIIDGSARLEEAATVFDEDAIILEHDGTMPIVAVRTDIPNAQEDRAKRIALEANRIAQIDLNYDAELLAQLEEGSPEVLQGLFTEGELNVILGRVGERTDANAEWVGMPEFHQEDQTPFRTIIVHFDNPQDVAQFAQLLHENISDLTKFIWYPHKDALNLKDYEVGSEIE